LESKSQTTHGRNAEEQISKREGLLYSLAYSQIHFKSLTLMRDLEFRKKQNFFAGRTL